MQKKFFSEKDLRGLLLAICLDSSREASLRLLDYLVSSQEFLIKPAGAKVHHSFNGGLLQHTCEVLEHALFLNDFLDSPVPKDDLIVACFLHDLGKVYAYYKNKSGSWAAGKTCISQESIAFHWAAKFGLPLNYNIICGVEFAHGGWSIVAKEWNIEPLPVSVLLHAADQFSTWFGVGGIVELKKEAGIPLFV